MLQVEVISGQKEADITRNKSEMCITSTSAYVGLDVKAKWPWRGMSGFARVRFCALLPT